MCRGKCLEGCIRLYDFRHEETISCASILAYFMQHINKYTPNSARTIHKVGNPTVANIVFIVRTCRAPLCLSQNLHIHTTRQGQRNISS